MTIQAVEDGRSDIGIFAHNISAPRLETQPYRRNKLVVLVSQNHVLAQEEGVSLEDTIDYDYVAICQGSSLLRKIIEAASHTEKRLKVRRQINSFDGLWRTINTELGIGILPLKSVHSELLESKLRAMRLQGT